MEEVKSRYMAGEVTKANSHINLEWDVWCLQKTCGTSLPLDYLNTFRVSVCINLLNRKNMRRKRVVFPEVLRLP